MMPQKTNGYGLTQLTSNHDLEENVMKTRNC